MEIKITTTNILIITTMTTASNVIVKAATVVLYAVVFYAAAVSDVEASIADVVVVAAAVFLPQGVFVVVHPYFEHSSANADLIAESLHRHFVGFLHFPPQFFGEVVHFILLFLGEFRAEPLSPGGVLRLDGGGGHRRQVVVVVV